MTSSRDFTDAYARFLPPVRAKCRRMLGRGALADEIAQEAFTRLWQSGLVKEAGTSSRTIMAWLYVTSTRLATDVLREGRVRSLNGEEGEELAVPAGGTSPAELAAARAAIVQLSRTIPADELEVALLTRVDGLSQPEAAGLLGVSERTVRRLLERFDERSGELREEVVG